MQTCPAHHLLVSVLQILYWYFNDASAWWAKEVPMYVHTWWQTHIFVERYSYGYVDRCMCVCGGGECANLKQERMEVAELRENQDGRGETPRALLLETMRMRLCCRQVDKEMCLGPLNRGTIIRCHKRERQRDMYTVSAFASSPCLPSTSGTTSALVVKAFLHRSLEVSAAVCLFCVHLNYPLQEVSTIQPMNFGPLRLLPVFATLAFPSQAAPAQICSSGLSNTRLASLGFCEWSNTNNLDRHLGVWKDLVHKQPFYILEVPMGASLEKDLTNIQKSMAMSCLASLAMSSKPQAASADTHQANLQLSNWKARFAPEFSARMQTTKTTACVQLLTIIQGTNVEREWGIN